MQKKRNRISWQDDPDWKPEMPEPVQEQPAEPDRPATTDSNQPVRVSGQIPFSYNQVHKGLLNIIELEYNPPRFILILDKDKELMRFPFGGLEETDFSPARGAEREIYEEVGITGDVGTPISDDSESFIGEVNFKNSLFYVFTKKVPASTEVVLGIEQEEWAAVTADTVDRFAKEGLITTKHIRAWEVFKRKRWP